MSKLPVEDAPDGEIAAVLGPHVKQVHCDFAKEIEKARQEVFSDSVKAGDFRHMIGNVKDQMEGKLKPAEHDAVNSRYHQILKALRRSRERTDQMARAVEAW